MLSEKKTRLLEGGVVITLFMAKLMLSGDLEGCNNLQVMKSCEYECQSMYIFTPFPFAKFSKNPRWALTSGPSPA